MSPMRSDEEFCRTKFEEYLKAVDPMKKLIWEDGTQNEPPDFFLNAGGERFAVEVTTLFEPVEVGSRVLPRQSVDAARVQFIKHVEQMAVEEGILNGSYYVLFPPIRLTGDFPKRRKQLEIRLLDYLRRTQANVTTPLEAIEVDEIHYCSVLKTSRPKSQFVMGSLPITFEWGDSAEEKACGILQAAVADKTEKLSGIQLHKILLLLNQYPFVDDDFYKQCASSVPVGLDSFHTVFIIGSQQCYVLYSVNNDWKR